MIKQIISALGILGLTACVSVDTPLYDTKEQLAVTSIFLDEVNITPSSTYAFTPLQSNEKGELYPNLTAEIEVYMAERSVEKVASNETPTFLVGYILRKNNDPSEQKLVDTFGVDPGLPDLPELDKGTMLVFILDGDTKNFLWRGAAQGFIIESNTPEERQIRLKKLVHSIFAQFDNK